MFKRKTYEFVIEITFSVVLAIILLLFGSFTCSKKNKLNSIELNFSYPVSFYKKDSEIRIYNIHDTIRIYYYKDYVLYQLSGSRKFETDELIAGTEQYFIYNSNNKFGFLFSSLKDSSLRMKIQVDSFLFDRGMKGKDFDHLPDSLWFLSDERKDNESNIVEKYASIKPGDETSIDSIYYYYSKKMNDIPYSFSKKLDSIKSMKLFRIRMIYNEKFSKTNNFVLPQREILFEIRKRTNFNEVEIINFINNYAECCDN